MNAPTVPPIPVRLRHRPLYAGLVVPWITARFVFAMRDRDLDRQLAAEAAMHPECVGYSITACPTAGRMDHYRASGHTDLFAGIGIVLGDNARRRVGQSAEPWHAVWARGYTVITDPITNLPAALLLPHQILRVRPIAARG